MADSHTPYWSLTQPEVSGSRDTWGTKINDDLAKIDTLLQALMPIGAMTDYAGNSAPMGWLLCDGSIYPINSYPRLFAAIGNSYGGDGSSNFAVPDTRGRATMGVGTTVGDLGYSNAFYLGQRAGDGQVPIVQANLPNTNITTNFAGNHWHPNSVSDATGSHSHSGGTDNQGGHAHSTWLVNLGVGAASGPFGVMSDAFGASDHWSSTDGTHWHNFFTDVQGYHQHALGISADGNHQHTFSLDGGGVALRILPPMFGVTKIICCGPPSMQSLGAIPAAPSAMLMASPLRGMH